MGLWDKFFRKSSDGSKAEAAADGGERLPEFPYELVQVSGAQAVQTCLKLRNEGQGRFTPVILGHREEVARVDENRTIIESPTPEEMLRAAGELTAEKFFAKIKGAEPDLLEQVEVGEWPAKVAPSGLTAHTEILSGRPKKIVFIAKVPTANSFEVPAFLSLGDWNACPAPEEHVAVLRHWHEQFGADIISATGDVIECTVARPPRERDAAIKLAYEQFLYCTDIVHQGVGTIMNLAATLKDSDTWYFWWD